MLCDKSQKKMYKSLELEISMIYMLFKSGCKLLTTTVCVSLCSQLLQDVVSFY